MTLIFPTALPPTTSSFGSRLPLFGPKSPTSGSRFGGAQATRASRAMKRPINGPSEPDDHGIEWFSTKNPDGSTTRRVFPLPRSFASVKRGFSEKKWQDTKAWTRKMLARTGNRKYRPSNRQKPDPTVAKASRRLASRFYKMKTGHCSISRGPAADRTPPAGGVSTGSRLGNTFSRSAHSGRVCRGLCGQPFLKKPAISPAPPGPGPHQHRGAARRRAVQPGGAPVFRDNRRRTDVRPTGGQGRRGCGQ